MRAASSKTLVLVTSVRHPQHVVEAALIGTDICSTPFGVFQKLWKHLLTEVGSKKFLADWNAQLQRSLHRHEKGKTL